MYAQEEYLQYKAKALESLPTSLIPVLENMRPWKTGEVVLVYGCEFGGDTLNLVASFATASHSVVHAVNCSRETLISEKNKSLECVRYYSGNILDSTWCPPHRTYDRIFVADVMHYVGDYRAALKGFYRLLKPGGQIGLRFFIQNKWISQGLRQMSSDPILGVCMEGIEKCIPNFLDEPTPQEALQKFLRAGINQSFLIVFAKHYGMSTCLARREMIELGMQLNPFAKYIPEGYEPLLRFRTAQLVEQLCLSQENGTYREMNSCSATIILQKPQDWFL